MYAAYKPFIEDEIDTLSEAAQWQLFFVMFSALAIRVNLDDESLQDKKMFDMMMILIQFLAPGVMVLNKVWSIRGGNVIEKVKAGEC